MKRKLLVDNFLNSREIEHTVIFSKKEKYSQKLRSLLLIALMAASMQEATAAIYNVTNTNDAGAGSLRQAIINANATPAGI